MSDFSINIAVTFFKAQLLLVPVMIFYIVCHLSKINPRFRWLVHRISAILFVAVPAVLFMMTYFPGMLNSRPRISPELDLPRTWIPDEHSEASAEPALMDQVIVSNMPAEAAISDMEALPFTDSAAMNTADAESVPAEKGYHSGFDFRMLVHIIPLGSILLFLSLIARLSIQAAKEKRLRRNSRLEYFRSYPVYFCPEINTPFSTGIFSKRIYIPCSINSRNRREPILNHEYAHLKGNHIFWSLLENIILYLYLYNPFCYFFRKNGERLKELLADEYAGRFTDKIDYSRILVDEIEELSRKEHIYIAAGFNKKKIMKERIMNLLNPVIRKPSALLKACGIIAILLCSVMTTMIGCSDGDRILDPDDFSYVNISTLQELNDPYNLVREDYSGDKLILDSTVLMTSPENELILPIRVDEKLVFNIYDSSDRLTDTVSVSPESGRVYSYTTDGQGRIVVLSYNEQDQSSRIERLNDDGSLSLIMKIRDIEIIPECLIEIDEKDRLYLRNENILHIYYDNGREIESGEQREIRSMTLAPGGRLYYILWEEPNLINYIDAETLEQGSIETSCENITVSSSGDSLLVMDARGIKEYKDAAFSGYITSSEDYPELIGLFNADFVKAGRNIYLTAWDFNSSILYLYRLQITDQKRLPDERPPLNIQVPEYLYQSMAFAARTYNKGSKDVRIEVSQYEDYDDSYEAYHRKLATEILAGKGPDIIFMSYLPWDDFIDNGVLADLNEFIDRDPSFNKTNYLPALTAIERNSGLYGLALNIYNDDILFSVKSSVMEKYGFSGSYNDISWEKIIEIAVAERRTDSNGMEIYPFGIPNFEGYQMYYISRILSKNNSFLEPETGVFREDAFRTFLSTIERLVNGDLVKPELSGITAQYRSMEDGSTVFFLKDLGDFWVDMVEKKHLFNNEAVMTIHPNLGVEDLAFRTTLLGISSGSDHKEAAWDFLSTILTEEYQDRMFSYAVPVNRALLEKRAIFSMKNPEEMSCSFSDDTGYVDYIGAADYSEQDLKAYLRNIERYKKASAGASPLDDVILEQLEHFLDGDMSLDETIAIVKDRVYTYINE